VPSNQRDVAIPIAAWIDKLTPKVTQAVRCGAIDTLFDTLTGRLPETPGDSLTRLRHKSGFD
jgi:hypothetical protein